MQPCDRITRTRALTVLLGLLAAAPFPTRAQTTTSGMERPHFGIGYAANAPNVMAGGGLYRVTSLWGGLGFYIDAKFDVEDPSGQDEFESGLTAGDVLDQVEGARFVKRESSYKSFNAALMKPVSPYLILYAGGGVVQRTRYHLYQAPDSDLGVAGIFWVRAPLEDDTQGNFMVGAFMRVSSFLSTQVGIETEPKGFTIGVSIRLPRG